MIRRSGERGYTMIELMVVVALVASVGAISVPMLGNAIGYFRLTGDARELANTVALAKIRAASDFSQARVYVDLGAKSYRVEIFRKTGPPAWVQEGGVTAMSYHVTLGFGSVTAPPPNTQAAIAQAPACRDAAGSAIANTACVVFNSRGVPIDDTGAPTAGDALYLADATSTYGVTVAASGQIQMWRRGGATAWTKQ